MGCGSERDRWRSRGTKGTKDRLSALGVRGEVGVRGTRALWGTESGIFIAGNSVMSSCSMVMSLGASWMANLGKMDCMVYITGIPLYQGPVQRLCTGGVLEAFRAPCRGSVEGRRRLCQRTPSMVHGQPQY